MCRLQAIRIRIVQHDQLRISTHQAVPQEKRDVGGFCWGFLLEPVSLHVIANNNALSKLHSVRR
jgi:hypothetical protein